MEFMRKVVEELAGEETDWQKITLVTPNRRASLFIKKYIEESTRISKPVWLPRIFSIQDFVSHVTGLSLPDPLTLLFQLYGQFVFCTPERVPFDAFYPWGRTVLSDFGDIDSALTDRTTLFKKLIEFSRIDETFAAGGEIQKKYRHFAGIMETLYSHFTGSLLKNHQAYYGMAARFLIEHFEPHRFERLHRIIFAGFNALLPAEQALFQRLVESGNAECYWDLDRYFLEDTIQESGYFFRNNPLIDVHHAKWISDTLLNGKKSIELIGASGKAAQAKVMGVILMRENIVPGDIAVVLPDESLLFPVLHSIPDSISRINVTMGYPLKNTSLFRLFRSLCELHLNRDPGRDAPFHLKEASRVLLHPYILRLADEEIRAFLTDANHNNRILISPAGFACLGNAAAVFTPVQSVETFIPYVRKLFQSAAGHLRDEERFSMDMEILFHFDVLLSKMEDLFSTHGIRLELRPFYALFSEMIASEAVPFLGEPLEGLQVMGLLETRALDFREVIVLSCNEGILPAGRKYASFIPDEIRNSLGLSTHMHQDAIYAYTLYRLIRGAEKVTLISNTAKEGFGRAERSRFAEQIVHEYKKRNPKAEVHERTVGFRAHFEMPEQRAVEKRDEIIARMKTMQYSPTALQMYVDCSLRFYFRYLLRLKEKEKASESADSRIFGQVIHRTLENMFRELEGHELQAEALQALSRRVRDIVGQSYQEILNGADIRQGRNYISCRIIEILIGQYLAGEKTGKHILGIEKTFEKTVLVESQPIRLRGTIDRIESSGDIIDVLDFKTGPPESLTFDLDRDWDRDALFPALRRRNVLQLLIYLYLVHDFQDTEEKKRVRAGMYNFRARRDEKGTSYLSLGGNPFFPIQSIHNRITPLLKQVFLDLFDRGTPFHMTEDTDACSFCSYCEICGR